MDANNLRREREDTRQNGSPSCPDRIVDRNIERRALPQSFSSNLARQRPFPGLKVPDRSVRAMVSLFEKPAGTVTSPPANKPRLVSHTSDTVTISDGTESHRGGHESNSHDDKTTKRPQGSQQKENRPINPESKAPLMFPPAQPSYQVEEYSLTLLKHKSYFNNRPLARCLDDLPEKDTKTKIQRVKSGKGEAKETATENAEIKRGGDQEKKGETDIMPPNRNETSSPVQQLDDLMSALLTWKEISETSTPELDHQYEQRDPEEVKRFWGNVRKQLWVDEEEIYGERPSPPPQVDSADVLTERNNNHALTPSTSAASIPASYHSESASELSPPPMPARHPSLIPAVPRERSFSTTSLQTGVNSTTSFLEPFPGLRGHYPAWDEPQSASAVRLSISAGYFDTFHPVFDEYPEPELPPLPTPGRPLPIPPTQPSHSRYPSSSGSSGPWTRPPTWRSPSTLRSSSPPRVPPLLPTPIPTPTATTPTNHPPYRHHRANHSRNRHQPHSSKASASFSTTHSSVAVTDSTRTSTSGGSRSLHSSSRRTTESTTRSTRAGSSATDAADVVASAPASRRPSGALHPAPLLHPPPPRRRMTEQVVTPAPLGCRRPSGALAPLPLHPPPPRRRMTAEEKLEEIDAFLSPEREVVGKGGWI